MAQISEDHKGEMSRSEYTRTHCSQKILSVLLIFSLSIAFVACTAGSSPQQATRPSTSTPTPAGPPSGTMLFQSNWKLGLAGWQASPGWKVIHGMLQSDLSSNNNLTVPYISKVPDYTLEVRFQIMSVPKNGGYFVVTADRMPDKNGYTAGIQGLLSPAPHNEFVNPQIEVYLNPLNAMDSQLVVSDYEPGSVWHTFDIEVNGSNVSFRNDGLRKSYASSTQTDVLSNGPFHVVSSGAVVRISSVSVSVL